jgi:hypothetical protein
MERNITFDFKKDQKEALSLAKSYFGRQEFILVDETNNCLTFIKGNIWKNMITYNPLDWKSKIIITIIGNKFNFVAQINTFGQYVTPKEIALWDIFIENLKKTVLTKEDYVKSNFQSIEKTVQSGYIHSGYFVLGAFFVGVPSLLLAEYLKMPSIVIPLTIGGGVGFLKYKISREEN